MPQRKGRRGLVAGAVLVVSAIGYVAGQCAFGPGPEDESALLYGRSWTTEAPERDTDFFHGLVVLEDQRLGAFFKLSRFRLEEEVFEHEGGREGTLEVRFPQTGRRARLAYQVRRCDELPPYDLCLTLRENPWGGPRRYYAQLEQDDEDEASRERVRRLRRLAP